MADQKTKHLKFFGIGKILPYIKEVRKLMLVMVIFGLLGSVADIDLQDWHNNQKTFMGYYGQIIQRMKEIQPQAKFFLMTMPDGEEQELL